MKFINNILGRFKTDCIEEHLSYRRVVSDNVIDTMSVKYGEVNTSVKDTDVLYQEIRKTREDIRCHNKLSPSGQSRCKKVEDDHNDHDNELRMQLKILNELYKKVVTIELNKFPLNKPCTINYIANYIGVEDESIIWNILISETIKNVVPSICYYDSNRYSISVSDLSESEIRILVVRKYGLRDIYHDYEHHDKYNIHTMILPNWRFVKSMDSSIFYVERV